SRLNVKWPQPVDAYDVAKYRYVTSSESASKVDSESSAKSSRKSRRSKREKRDRRSRKDKKKKSSSKSTPKEAEYIMLTTGEDLDESDRSVRPRRERKRMVVQTSPAVPPHSYDGSGFHTDDDGRKIDSVVFDTRSAMMRYNKSADVLPSRKSSSSRSSKLTTAVEHTDKEEYERYYLGVLSRRSVERKINRPGEFGVYYEKPGEGAIPISVNLYLAYRSSGDKAYHFPIQCFEGGAGRDKHFVVMQNKNDGKMFPSILSLVKHYSLYAHVDPSTGRLETFRVPH
ncbi:hypothetical protein PFISCL1PPCAC_9427, partial [Pristionchus fissidentatus]